MKRAFLYLFILAVLFIPYLSNAEDISVTGNIPTDNLIDSVALSPNTGMAYGIDKQLKNLYIDGWNCPIYSITESHSQSVKLQRKAKQ